MKLQVTTKKMLGISDSFSVSRCKQLEVTADRMRTSSLWLRKHRFVLLFYRLSEITVLLRVRENCSISRQDTPLSRSTKADCILDHRWSVLTPEAVVSCPFITFILVPHHTTNTEYTGYTQKNAAVSKVNKKFISHLTWAQLTPSAAATIQVSHALPAVRFSCLLRGRGATFQDGVAAGKGFLCAPF